MEGLNDCFRQQDILILDRGYRDAIPHLQGMGALTLMPPLLENGNQFETADANMSRILTKTRWIVEARNGHLKNMFKFRAYIKSSSRNKSCSTTSKK